MATKITYNEARTAIERIRVAISAFDQAAEILAKAEEAEGIMRVYQAQTAKFQSDWETASLRLSEVQSRLTARREELRELNAAAAKESRDRELALAEAIKSENANYKAMTDQLEKDFRAKSDQYNEQIDGLLATKTQLEARVSGLTKVLEDQTRQAQEFRAKFESEVAKVNELLKAGTAQAQNMLNAIVK